MKGIAVTSIEILQSSNEASARLLSDEMPASEQSSEASSGEVVDNGDSATKTFIDSLSTDFALSDCIINKSEHATIEEQRQHYGKRMREMAESAANSEEDGWTLYGKTNDARVSDDKQLEIYKRDVEWSPVPQLCSAIEVGFAVEAVFTNIGVANDAKALDQQKEKNKALEKIAGSVTRRRVYRTQAGDRSSVTSLFYREIKAPW